MRRRSLHLNWRALALLGALLSIAIEWPGMVNGMPAALLPVTPTPSSSSEPLTQMFNVSQYTTHRIDSNLTLTDNNNNNRTNNNKNTSNMVGNPEVDNAASIRMSTAGGDGRGDGDGESAPNSESVSDNKQLHSIMRGFGEVKHESRTFNSNSSAINVEGGEDGEAWQSDSFTENQTKWSFQSTTEMPLETTLNKTTTTTTVADVESTSSASVSNSVFTFSSSQHIAILSRTERSIRVGLAAASAPGGGGGGGGIVRRSSDTNGGLAKSKRLNNSRNANSSNNDNNNNHNTSSNHHNNNSNSKHNHHQQQQQQQAISNLDRNERSTISHLSGPSRKIQLYIKNRFIQLLPDGTVNGTQDELSVYTILQRSTVDVGRIKIQGVATCLYLCMDQCGAVYGSKDFTDDCVFNENMEQHNYNTYSSTYNSNARKVFYLALNRHGEPRRLQIPPTRSLGKLATYTNAITETVPQERVDQLIAKNFGANRIKHGIRQLCDTGKPLVELIDSKNFKARPQCNPTSSGSPHSSSSSSSNKSTSSLSSGSRILGNSNNGQSTNNVPAANDNTRLSSSNSSTSTSSSLDGDSPRNISSNSNSSSSSSISQQNGHTSSNNSSSTGSGASAGHHPHQSQKNKKKKRRKCRPHENEEEHNCHRGPQALKKRGNGGGGGGPAAKQQKCRELLQQQQQQEQQGNGTAEIVIPKFCNGGPKKGPGGPKKNMPNNKKARGQRNGAGPNRGKKPGNGLGKVAKIIGAGGGGGGKNGGQKKKAKNPLAQNGPKKGGKKKAGQFRSSTSLAHLLGLESTSLSTPTSTIYDAPDMRGRGDTTSDRGDREQRNVRFTNSMEEQEGVSGEEVVDDDDDDVIDDDNTDSYEEDDTSSPVPVAGNPTRSRAPYADEAPSSMNSGADDFMYYDQFDFLLVGLWEFVALVWITQWSIVQLRT